VLRCEGVRPLHIYRLYTASAWRAEDPRRTRPRSDIHDSQFFNQKFVHHLRRFKMAVQVQDVDAVPGRCNMKHIRQF
ncbi:unnamed protein product, partial [Nesidiocoris tenuis]